MFPTKYSVCSVHLKLKYKFLLGITVLLVHTLLLVDVISSSVYAPVLYYGGVPGTMPPSAIVAMIAIQDTY